MNLLEQLKKQTIVVSDTGDFESVKLFKPVDATTNPSLIYAAAKESKYAYILDEALKYARQKSSDKQQQVGFALDRLIVGFGLEILKIIPGRVSTEVDARLSFDTGGSISKAR